MPIKNETMRDAPKRPIIDRLRSRGLIGGLFPSGEDALIAKAFQQFREGVPAQTELGARETIGITAPGQEPIMFPAREAVQGVQAEDVENLQRKLIGIGPEGIALAKELVGASPKALGRQGSRAKIKQVKTHDPSGREFVNFIDPFTGANISEARPTGKNVFDDDVKKLANTLSSQKIPLAIAPLLKVDEFMKKFSETGKIPGVGLLKNLRTAEFFRTPPGKMMANASRRLSELELRILTGAAAPDLEKRRVDVMNALSAANTADDYVRIYSQVLRPLWKDIIENSLGGVNPGVRNRWAQGNVFAGRVNKFLSTDIRTPSQQAPAQAPAGNGGFKILSVTPGQ